MERQTQNDDATYNNSQHPPSHSRPRHAIGAALLGTRRPDNSLYWKKGFGEFTVGLLYQLGHDGQHSTETPLFEDGVFTTETEYSGYERDHRDEAALDWKPNKDVTLGRAFHHPEMSDYESGNSDQLMFLARYDF
ncbi:MULTISPECIES: hypothetical protein [unclassified Cobetia]|uniref:hypothetical protein n=1 Tax=unclassified Cobetia TaxID=2609414 RepID=UPI00209786DB|nr:MULTISPECIES: hypothetical protein [unclassified Cobetia]MCO7233417.1 hypothetical protein [Cobetia sp. Dlab-2-AX]MCO7236519.1 hypothetical protein [Cobetia sp. Dlab-2-U]